MKWSEAKALVFATGTAPDGYFGKRIKVEIAYDPECLKTLFIWETPKFSGFYNSGLPDCMDREEAFALLQKDWYGQNIKKLKKVG